MRGLPKIDLGRVFVSQVVAKARGLDAVPMKGLQRRSGLSALMHLSEHLLDLLERRETPSTHTLDEFGDFPPLSMGCVYFKIIGERG